jgi:hypothetical protein
VFGRTRVGFRKATRGIGEIDPRGLLKALTVGAVVSSLGLILVLVFFGPHDWDTYAPNVVVGLAELTVGAFLVGSYVRLRRRVKEARMRRLVDGQLFQAVARLLRVLQASYMEAAEHPAPSVPMTEEEVLTRWVADVQSLDLRRPTTLEPATRWATYLPREILSALNDLAVVISRFPDLTAHVVEPLLELEMDDEFIGLLRYLPDSGPVNAPGVPSTLTPYLGISERPVALEQFSATVQTLADATRTADGQSFFDEYSWMEVLPPLWGSGRFRPEEDARERAETEAKAKRDGITSKIVRVICALRARPAAG